MRRVIYFILGILPLLFSTSCYKTTEYQQPIQYRIICEELYPYSYVDNGKLKGISVEIVEKLCALQGIGTQKIEVTTDWQQALEVLQSSNNVILFTTDYTAERKNKMQWAGPVTIFETSFTGLRSGGFKVSSISEAKLLPSVGVIRGYSTAEILKDLDFTNLVYYNSLSEAVDALYKQQTSVVFDILGPIVATAARSGHDAGQLTGIYNYGTAQGFLAFSPSMSPDVVTTWQDKLDAMKMDGTMQQIYNTWLPGEKAPGLVTIYTEENPSLNFRDSTGHLTGSSVEMLEAMMKITGSEDRITLTTWNDGYSQTLLAPNSMIFSTVRNAERENLFNWVGPVCKKNYCFFVRTDNPVQLNTIDDAKALSKIAVPEGWASYDQLVSLGFTNLVTFTTPEEVFLQLVNKQVDAAVLNDIAIDYLAKELGYDPKIVRNALLLSPTEAYLAFCKDIKPVYLQEYQQAYTTIVNNGTLSQIWKKWYPSVPW